MKIQIKSLVRVVQVASKSARMHNDLFNFAAVIRSSSAGSKVADCSTPSSIWIDPITTGGLEISVWAMRIKIKDCVMRWLDHTE